MSDLMIQLDTLKNRDIIPEINPHLINFNEYDLEDLEIEMPDGKIYDILQVFWGGLI